MLDMGGVPVDRTSSKNYVEAMIAEFNRRKEFMLTIAPEGTRGSVKAWKTGFYHIAVGAKVPIALGYLDYKNKIAGVGKMLYPSGDMEKDMKEIMAFYKPIQGKHSERFSIDLDYA